MSSEMNSVKVEVFVRKESPLYKYDWSSYTDRRNDTDMLFVYGISVGEFDGVVELSSVDVEFTLMKLKEDE